MEVGEEGDYIPMITLSPQNDSYIKMGNDESNFNVSFIVRNALPLGQTGSLNKQINQ